MVWKRKSNKKEKHICLFYVNKELTSYTNILRYKLATKKPGRPRDIAYELL